MTEKLSVSLLLLIYASWKICVEPEQSSLPPFVFWKAAMIGRLTGKLTGPEMINGMAGFIMLMEQP